jgi:carboxypeptidase family protein
MGDKPASGALLKFKRVDNGSEPYTRITDIEGNFAAVRAKPGKYTVTATLTGLSSTAEPITVTEDSDQEIVIVIKEQTATPPTTGTVEGTVTKDGTAAAGVDVVLKQGTAQDKSTKTAQDGKFKFEKIPAGDCTVVATLGDKTKDAKVTVVAGQTQTVPPIQFP